MDVNAFTLSKQISDLVDRPVHVAEADSPMFSDRVLYACYQVLPNENLAMVKLDVSLLGALAGSMIGMPTAALAAQVRGGQLDENLLDAGREIMNVLSPILGGEDRAVFDGIFTSPMQYSRQAEQLLKGGTMCRASFKATLAGQLAGYMTFLSDKY